MLLMLMKTCGSTKGHGETLATGSCGLDVQKDQRMWKKLQYGELKVDALDEWVGE